MKKVIGVVLTLILAISFTACGGSGAESKTPPDLSGDWKQSNNQSADSYQAAIISGDTIEIYWVSDGGDTKALYWAGSFVAPTDTTEPYKWDSKNDTEKTGSALLASSDDTKSFSYENGKISYQVSAMGVTTTVELEKA